VGIDAGEVARPAWRSGHGAGKQARQAAEQGALAGCRAAGLKRLEVFAHGVYLSLSSLPVNFATILRMLS
jgi:hypothetical protein